MPYGKRRAKDGTYTVYNLLTGRVYGRRLDKGTADRQLAVLRSREAHKAAMNRRHRGRRRLWR